MISFTVKLNGVHGGGDFAASITATLLLGLLMPERFALSKFKHVVGLLAPVTVGSHLEVTEESNKALYVHKDSPYSKG